MMKRILIALAIMAGAALPAAADPFRAEEQDWARVKADALAFAIMAPVTECSANRARCTMHILAKNGEGKFFDALEITRSDGTYERRSCLYYGKDLDRALCRFFRRSGRIDFRPMGRESDGQWKVY